MININNYISEKLKIDKDININNDNPDKNFTSRELKKVKNDTLELIVYWSRANVRKVNNMTNSIIERYQLCYIVQEYCKVNSSEYNDISKVKIIFTDKGNIGLYYDHHYLGAYGNLKDYPITKEFLKKFDLLDED